MNYNTWLGPLPGFHTRNIKAIKTVIYCSLPPIPKPGLWNLKPTNGTWPMLYSYHLQYILGKTKMCDSVSIFSGVSFSFWGHIWGANKCVCFFVLSPMPLSVYSLLILRPHLCRIAPLLVYLYPIPISSSSRLSFVKVLSMSPGAVDWVCVSEFLAS